MDRIGAHIEDNDPCLAPLLRARAPAAREEAIERIVAEHVQPVIVRTLRRHPEGEEIASAVHIRVLRRLQHFPAGDPIRNLADYVATIAHNAIYDDLRRRHPERTRLKNRLRYAITHDRRFALWETSNGSTCGLASWSGRPPRDIEGLLRDATPEMRDGDAIGDALEAILLQAEAPLLLDQLVQLAMALWDIAETPSIALHDVASEGDALAQFESREALAEVWREIRALRPNQRAALLLNLRDLSGNNAAVLLVHLGISTVDDIALQAGFSPSELAEIWDELPLDDLTIAARLGVTRQQVINMRKAARQRLARRTTRSGKP